MKDSIYILIDRGGIRGMRKGKPRLASGEIAVRVEINVPSIYFDRYIPTAYITLPEPLELTEDDVEVGFGEVIESDPLDILFEEDNDAEAN